MTVAFAPLFYFPLLLGDCRQNRVPVAQSGELLGELGVHWEKSRPRSIPADELRPVSCLDAPVLALWLYMQNDGLVNTEAVFVRLEPNG
jgi:hypothetical protein